MIYILEMRFRGVAGSPDIVLITFVFNTLFMVCIGLYSIIFWDINAVLMHESYMACASSIIFNIIWSRLIVICYPINY